MANLPQFVSIAPDGVVEYYMDHTLLSDFRGCEAKFALDFLENYRGRGATPWALQFGSCFHDCMEWFYTAEIKKAYPEFKEFVEKFVSFSAATWRKYNMDFYKDMPQYKRLNGFSGFLCLIGQYAEYYKREFNKLKPVALEIPFGRNKEVPLLEDHTLYRWAPFRLYYAGRLDYIFDDGSRLGPLDHKTFSRTDKNPVTGYEVQEGMTGYVYAMRHIYNHLKAKFWNDSLDLGIDNVSRVFTNYDRRVDVVWMNFIAVPHDADIHKRFQRIPIFKTDFQLEEWRLRQISTVAKLHQVLFEGRVPDYNANACTNWFFGVCSYQQVHRQDSIENQLIILNNHFEKATEPWNPEKPRTVSLD